MEQALRAVERLAKDQNRRLLDLQRGHAQLEEALAEMRTKSYVSAEPRAERRDRTPPPSSMPLDGGATPLTPQRTPRRTPVESPPYYERRQERVPAESSRYAYDDASQETPRTETSGRTPRSQRGVRYEVESPRTETSVRTPRSQGMVRSSTDPNLGKSGTETSMSTSKNYRDDPRFKETGKPYADWPAYPEWQDMPLRKFGAGYGKKILAHKDHIHADGECEAEKFGLQTNGDTGMVDGIARCIGHGRRKFVSDVTQDHFGMGLIPTENDIGKHGHTHQQDDEIGHGKQHYVVKDHLGYNNDDCSTQVSSRTGSRAGGSSRSSGTASRPRSTR